MEPEHFDVLIVGAGLSGIGSAHHLQDECPGKTYAILEARDASGGTWDLFRYPGIRSDSDMLTLGYSFRPWPEAKAIADGPAILSYVRKTASEAGIDRHIRYHHRVVAARWSSEDARWTLEVERGGTNGDAPETVQMTCNFLHGCSGYYRYDEGYTPEFAGTERFGGEIVHPQKWTDEIDYAGKRVVVIGSGATAVTLVPAMAETAAHVTMLQRSPSYVVSLPGVDPIAKFLRRFLPQRIAFTLLKWKNVAMTMFSFELSRRRPELAKKLIRKGVERRLPPGYDIDTHFTPNYNPWDQRMCLVPDGDLFDAISNGRASVVTDRIETFTESGLLLESGAELEADLIVTATGINLLPFGGIELSVDGERVSIPEKLAYKGMMLEDVPNLAVSIGYTNASWTLKCDLTCEYVCRLINHMDEHGYAYCAARNHDPSITPEPMIDFSSGYVQRSIDKFPKQGSRTPWRLHQNYARDILDLRRAPLEDGAMEFSRAPEREPQLV
ncbi:MAG TPA: NAD(P)/FAD-dependent oxidoreductase [Solirubrobacterales bacterium]